MRFLVAGTTDFWLFGLIFNLWKGTVLIGSREYKVCWARKILKLIFFFQNTI